jgi:uncharacterized coiled-coil protein SlyX
MEDFDDFEYDNIVAQSVLEAELQAATQAGNQDLVDKLEMATTILETNVETGMLTPQQYEAQLRAKIQEYEGCIAQGHRYAEKMRQHVRLMTNEVVELDQGAQESIKSLPRPPAYQQPEAPADRNPADQRPEVPPAPGAINMHERLLADNAMYRYSYAQLTELKQAFEYLRKCGLVERMGVILEKAETYQRVINEFRAGKTPSVPLVSLSPKDLFGTRESERQARLNELILAVGKLADHYKGKALEALRAKDTEEAQRLKVKMVENERHAVNLEALKLNPWLPLPKVSAQQVSERVKMVNEDIPENTLRITVEKAVGIADSEAVYAVGVLTLQGGESRFQTPTIRKAVSKGFNFVHIVQLEPIQLPNLDKRRFNVEIFNAQGVSMGVATIKTTPLEEHCTCPFTIPLNRSGSVAIKVVFGLRKALKVVEYATITSQQLQIVNYHPPFKHPDGRIYEDNSPRPVPSQPVASQPLPPAPQEERKSVPTGLSPDELQDPNVITNLNADSVLEAENKKLMEMIPRLRAEGKDVSKLLVQQREVARKSITLQQQVGNGVISPAEYKAVLLKSLEHDQILLQAFRDGKQAGKAAIVTKRIEMMETELKEMEGI